MRILILVTILALQSFMHPSHIKAQSRETYSGPYEWTTGETGTAEYQYTGDDDDRVKDGTFMYHYQTLDSLDESILIKRHIDGNYDDDQKHGKWTYNKEQHKVILKDVVDFSIDAELESQEETIEASYREGVPHGKWRLRERFYLRGELQPLFSSEDLTFTNGFVRGDFGISKFDGNNEITLKGRTNTSGYMEGIWEFTYLQDSVSFKETRRYDDGFLLYVEVIDRKSGKLVDQLYFGNTREKLSALREGGNTQYAIAEQPFGLYFNDGYSRSDQEYTIQTGGNAFIEEIFRELFEYDQGLYFEDDEMVVSPVRTRRFKYPFSNRDLSRASDIAENYDALKQEISLYAEMNVLNLNKQRSDSLAFAYTYFQVANEQLNDLDEAIEYLRSGDVQYIDQKNYLQSISSKIITQDTLLYDYDGETLRRPIELSFDQPEDSTLIEAIDGYLSAIRETTTIFADYTDAQLEEIELDQTIEDLEQRIISKKSEIDTLYANHSAQSTNEQRLIRSVQSNILIDSYEEKSQSYAQLDGYVDRIRKGEELLDLLNELEKVFPQLAKIFEENDEIDEEYQEETFNPFTYSRYEQRAKERLYEKGAVTLFNHYVRELKDEQDYTQIKEHIARIQDLHAKLRELREENTRRLERRLGRTDDVDQIESLLNL